MELREYQKKATRRLSSFTAELAIERERFLRLQQVDSELANDLHFPERAWNGIGMENYRKTINALGNPVPNIYLKVPTGGGKTLLACHAIDLVNKSYLSRRTGLVLWIVPTSQIYRQTIKALTDRAHPYRQVLDVSSGGKTLILEKFDRFTPNDIDANLCILILMLPSAARQSKEALKVFKDNTGYTEFFPDEDAYAAQEELLRRVPNLDTFGEPGGMWDQLPKTSLGNVLRLLQPMTIVDEGHKAYSDTARQTILGFNPSFLLELSATPPTNANKLVEITGKELNDEQMIKLDIHLVNKTTVGWKETVTAATNHRFDLEQKASEYEQNTDTYIRPILLIQVERTGKDQRDGINIHAEDVKEYLIKQCAVPEDQIAIKSTERDDIEGIDLLAKDCPLRFIITKQALQEGWDCPFAYILCALARSQAETAMTQLIGRVLRQPYARKTGIRALDECYVYSFQRDTSKLVSGIKQNLEGEGMGDLAGRISIDASDTSNPDYLDLKKFGYRDGLKHLADCIILPVFAVKENDSWREISYASDILSRIPWEKVDLDVLANLKLENKVVDDIEIAIGIDAKGKPTSRKEVERSYQSAIDIEYLTRQIVDIVPNPWHGYELAQRTVAILLQNFKTEIIASNTIFIVEELRRLLLSERDRLAETVFRSSLETNRFRFFLIKAKSLRSCFEVRSKKAFMNVYEGKPLSRSLTEYVPSEDINGFEEEVALFLDDREELLWWYRNMARTEYRIQGWKPGRIYPDFLAARKNEQDPGTYNKVYILEAKGTHLVGNEDSDYKQSILNLCNQLAVERDWEDLSLPGQEIDFIFKMIEQSNWKTQLRTALS